MKTLSAAKYLVVFLAIALASCSGGQSVDMESEEQSVPLVRVSTLVTQMIEQEVDYTGNVQAFKENHISPNQPSRIRKIFVEVGDMVKQGQLLVEMDNTSFDQVKTQLDNLEKEFARLDTLNRIGSIPQQQVDQVKTQLDIMRTNYKTMTENTQLRSPINGVITGRYYNDGDIYSMTPNPTGKAAVVSVMQIQPVKVLVNVPEMYFPNVKQGMSAAVTLDIYPDKLFNGKVHLVHPTIDPMTRTFTVEVEVVNNEMFIRPGMFARVRFGFGQIERVVVPDLAVQRQPGTNDRFVFVVDDNVAKRKVIRIGRRIDDSFEVLSGLTANQKVVVAGQASLLDGNTVEVEK
ncbi:efflux RND transporter periplasmic adaptor subunit [Perlabentimonas gracilis]|uniref:efflux RND transporter periplasmic adaptor subunit n=1 Tax=Perlabentimonas gracilis TaxID=2715279 RepID=UPI00140A0D03|nr:efflux RND transporter periplasmic adaptor subunit [Perlabentimonas gracilis]NHB68682.1 efflux RND transporter periplasmic adaptor subunit [Perlabentimonas gracilis]